MEKKYPDFIMKIGGSIFERGTIEQIRNLMDVLVEIYREKPRFIIVPGGGIFAEQVRELQQKFHFNDEKAHWMAIKAMEQQALLLQSFLPQSKLIEPNDEGVFNCKGLNRSNKYIPILLVGKFMRKQSKLEHSWNSTSDAIAVEIGYTLGIRKIIFVKDIDGIMVKGKVKAQMSKQSLMRIESSPLDVNTPYLLAKYNINGAIINGFYTNRLKEFIINKKKTICTEIID